MANNSRKLILLKAGLAAALLASGAVGGAAVAGGRSLAGSWSGGGVVTLPSGATERARCRATFHGSGSHYSMDAVCATASTRVAQTAKLRQVSASRFTGEFFNPDYNVSGSIRINLSGDSLSASLDGGGGSGRFNLRR